jgi:hypothetical protein
LSKFTRFKIHDFNADREVAGEIHIRHMMFRLKPMNKGMFILHHQYVCKGWAIKLAPAPRPSTISPVSDGI